MASTIARDLLRKAVLRTNAYWPFSRCNRWPYSAALYMFVRALRGRPEVRSVYLRRVLAQRDWIPGLSDIDLTLVLRGGLSADQEYDFLEFFWNTHARLKRFFPLLGEVEILDEDEFAPWLERTTCSPHSPSWTLLYGDPNSKLATISSPVWRQHALRMALWIYVDLIPPCLAMPDSSLRRQDILRRFRKIMQQLTPILAEMGQGHLNSERSEDPAELIADLLKAFEAAVAQVNAPELNGGSHSERGPLLLTARTGETILVTANGLDRDELARLLRSELPIQSRGRSPVPEEGPAATTPHTPLVLPRCLLFYMVQRYNPYDYSALKERWTCFGREGQARHPMTEIAPPGPEEFVAYSLDRIANFLIFARCDQLFSKALPAALMDQELNRALNAVLVLRTGRISRQRGDHARQWNKEFPEYSEAFETVGTLLREGRVPAARRASFDLCRSIARDAREFMRCSESVQPPAAAQTAAPVTPSSADVRS